MTLQRVLFLSFFSIIFVVFLLGIVGIYQLFSHVVLMESDRHLSILENFMSSAFTRYETEVFEIFSEQLFLYLSIFVRYKLYEDSGDLDNARTQWKQFSELYSTLLLLQRQAERYATLADVDIFYQDAHIIHWQPGQAVGIKGKQAYDLSTFPIFQEFSQFQIQYVPRKYSQNLALFQKENDQYYLVLHVDVDEFHVRYRFSIVQLLGLASYAQWFDVVARFSEQPQCQNVLHIDWIGGKSFACRIVPLGGVGWIELEYNLSNVVRSFLYFLWGACGIFACVCFGLLFFVHRISTMIAQSLQSMFTSIQFTKDSGVLLGEYTTRIREFKKLYGIVQILSTKIGTFYDQLQQEREALQLSTLQYQRILERFPHGVGIVIGQKLVYHNKQMTIRLQQFENYRHQENDTWYQVSFVPLVWEKQHAQLFFVEDITEQVHREQEYALNVSEIMQEVRDIIQAQGQFWALVGKSLPMQELYRQMLEYARLSHIDRIFIYGETGTGKELVARTLHQLSGVEGEFVALNCRAIPEHLFESEMFGYLKGAFTGADRNQAGYFAQANYGTLFIDELGDLPMSQQIKLLRVLETGEYYPVGSRKVQKISCQIFSATNQNIANLIQEGKFRNDLFYRLDLGSLFVPPLRQRQEDIPLLIEYFVTLNELSPLPPSVVKKWQRAQWVGNVRELRAKVLTYAVRGETGDTGKFQSMGLLQETIDDSERKAILQALEESQGNKVKAAQRLGVERRTLYRKLKKHGIDL